MNTKHTPGPWQWFERMPGRPYLATPDRGQLYVMGFERKGMQGAGPVFSHWAGIQDGAARERKGGIMEPGLLLRDGSMHPDARLIASAPETAEKAMAFTLLVERFVRGNEPGDMRSPVTDSELAEAMYALRVHIAKATGSTE